MGVDAGLPTPADGSTDSTVGSTTSGSSVPAEPSVIHDITLDPTLLTTLKNPKLSFYVLNRLSAYQEIITKQPKNTWISNQKALETQLLQLLTQEHGEMINTVAINCLISLFNFGKNDDVPVILNALYDTLKMREDYSTRSGCLCFLKHLFLKKGKSISYLVNDTLVLLGRLYKVNDEIKVEVLDTLNGIVIGCGENSATIQKDVYKIVKNGYNEKEKDVLIATSNCMLTLLSFGFVPTEVEPCFLFAVKAMEGTDIDTQEAIAKVLATLLSLFPEKSGSFPEDVLNPLATAFVKSSKESRVAVTVANAYSTTGRGKEVRVGLTLAYSHAVQKLGGVWLDRNLSGFISHTLNLLSGSRLPTSASDIVMTRQCIGYILKSVFMTCLDESGFVKATKELCKAIIKCGRLTQYSTAQHAIVVALNMITCLLSELKSVAKPVIESVKTTVMATLTYPTLSVRLSAARCMRFVALANPRKYAPYIIECVDALYSKNNIVECVHGYAYAISSMISAISLAKLGIPHGLSRSILTMAEELLNSAGSGGAQKAHQPRTRPRNATPSVATQSLTPAAANPNSGSPISKSKSNPNIARGTSASLNNPAATASHSRMIALLLVNSEAAWSCITALTNQGSLFFIDHMEKLFSLFDIVFNDVKDQERPTSEKQQRLLMARSFALSAVYAFIMNCNDLLDEEKIAKILKYLSVCLNMASQWSNNLINITGENYRILKVRMYNIYRVILPKPFGTGLPQLLRLIMSDLMNFHNDHYTSLLPELCEFDNEFITEGSATAHELAQQLSSQDIIGAFEYDPSSVISGRQNLNAEKKEMEPLPSPIAVIDSAVRLLGLIFPSCTDKHKKQLLDHLTGCIAKAKKTNTNKIHMNGLAVLLCCLRNTVDQKISINQGVIEGPISSIACTALVSDSPIMRIGGAQCLGLSGTCIGQNFMNKGLDAFVERLKTDTDAESRTGYAATLACIVHHGGRICTNRQVQVVLSMLIALAKDPSPIAQIWALHSIWYVAESTAFVNGSFLETTFDQVMSFLFSPHFYRNRFFVGRILNTLMSGFGPDLLINDKLRQKYERICSYFSQDSNAFCKLVAAQCSQSLIVFAGQHSVTATLLPFFLDTLYSYKEELRFISANSILELIKRDAQNVIQEGDGIELCLLQILNKEPNLKIRAILMTCLSFFITELGIQDPLRWVSYCDTALSSTLDVSAYYVVAADENATETAEEDSENEEVMVESLGQTVADKSFAPRSHLKIFAAECILTLIECCRTSPDSKFHFDLKLVNSKRKHDKDKFLVTKLNTLIRAAFNSSTSDCEQLRIIGISTLSKVVEYFCEAPDPLFEDILLLEQYQAQIGAALRQAFTEDASPEIISSAGRLCGIWLSSGIPQEINDLQKIQQLIVSPISDFDEVKYNVYSEAASVLVRVNLLEAWAFVQLACNGPRKFKYLAPIIDPFLPTLQKLWLQLLREYAILNLPDFYADRLCTTELLNQRWTRMTVKEFYKTPWITILEATGLLLTTEYGNVFIDASLETKNNSNDDKNENKVNESLLDGYPSDNLYLILDLCLQALANPDQQQFTHTALRTLKSLFTSRINWEKQQQTISEANADQPASDTIVELMNIFRTVLFTRDIETQTLVLEVVSKVITCENIFSNDLATEKDPVEPRIGEEEISNSRAFSILLVCVCGLSKYRPDLVPPSFNADLKIKKQGSLDNRNERKTQTFVLLCLDSLIALCENCVPDLLYKMCNIVMQILIQGLHSKADGDVQRKCLLGIKLLLSYCIKTDKIGNSDEFKELCHGSLGPLIDTLKKSLLDLSVVSTSPPSSSPSSPSRVPSSSSSSNVNYLILGCTVFVTTVPQYSTLYTENFIDCLKDALTLNDQQLIISVLQSFHSYIKTLPANYLTPYLVELCPSVLLLLHLISLGKIENNDIASNVLSISTDIIAISSEKNRQALFDIIIPLSITMLSSTSSASQTSSLNTLRNLGAQYPENFRDVILKIPASMKTDLETALRKSETKKSKTTKKIAKPAAPTIKLKMDFSNFG